MNTYPPAFAGGFICCRSAAVNGYIAMLEGAAGAMSYLWSFQSFRQDRFEALIADGPRCAAILRTDIEAQDRVRNAAVDEAIRRYRGRTWLNRVFERLTGRHGLPSVNRELFPTREQVLVLCHV